MRTLSFTLVLLLLLLATSLMAASIDGRLGRAGKLEYDPTSFLGGIRLFLPEKPFD